MKQQTHPHRAIHTQRGYTLLELSIVLVIMALVIMSWIAFQTEQAQADRARATAQIYVRMNNAAGSYLTNFYDKLLTLKPECSKPTWAVDSPNKHWQDVDVSSCGLDLSLGGRAAVRVRNGLQPMPNELAALGLLDGTGYVEGLPLKALTPDKPAPSFPGFDGNWAVAGANVNTDLSTGYLNPRFMFLVQLICLNPPVGNSALFDTTGGCPNNQTNRDGPYDLRSLVFNSQPYDLVGTLGTPFLNRVLQIAGSDAYLSDNLLDPRGELRTIAGAAEPMIRNPIRWPGTDTGAPYILAMRNGYGSAGWDRYVRRDGSTPMTSDWNYGNTNVTNISNMAVNSGLTVGNTIPDSTNGAGGTGSLTVNGATVMGTEKAEKNGDTVLTVKGSTNIKGNSVITGNSAVSGDSAVKGSSSVDGNSTVGGTLNASKGVFGKVTDTVSEALNAALQAASAYIQGPLTVGGDAKIKGSANVGGNLSTDGYIFAKEGIRMDKYRRVGEVCNPSIETLALQLSGNKQFTDGLRLLLCTQGSTAWEYPQPDLNGKIDNIWATINQGNFKINKTAKLGDSCAATDAPLAWQDSSTVEYTKGLRLLVCPPTSLKWSYPQPDIQAQLDAINSNLQSQIDDLKKSKSTAFIEYRTVPNDDHWQITDLPCDKWASPYLTSSGTGDDSGFKIDVWCEGTWKVLGYNGHGSSTGYTFGFIRIKN